MPLNMTLVVRLATLLLLQGLISSKTTVNPDCKKKDLEDKSKKNKCTGGYAYKCYNLTEVPTKFPEFNASQKLCELDLSRNNLSTIHSNSFRNLTDLKWLLLNENNLTMIESDAFSGLHKLLSLTLSSNKLEYPKSFATDVFKPLVDLKTINLQNNSIKSFDGLDDLLRPLRNLKELLISGCFNCTFGRGFEELGELISLNLSGTWESDGVPCNMSLLSNDTFIHVPKLKELSISFCNVTTVEPGALSALRYIETLDISYNPYLTFKGMRNVLSGLVNSSICILNANAIHERFERGTELKKDDIEPIQFLKKLKILQLELNKLEVVDEQVFDLIPNSLSHFMLAANRLTYGEYVKKVMNMKHIVTMDLSRQHLNVDPFLQKNQEHLYDTLKRKDVRQSRRYQLYDVANDKTGNDKSRVFNINYCHIFENKYAFHDGENIPRTTRNSESATGAENQSNCSECVDKCPHNMTCICAPEDLQILLWRASFVYVHIYELKVCQPNNLRQINLSFNLLEKWIGPVYGLENLEEFNLAECICYEMSPFFFDNFHSLKKLNVSFNNLGPSLVPEEEHAGTHFKNLRKLEMLDLTGSHIQSLASNIFMNMSVLKDLFVGENLLTQWNVTLTTNCLRVLDLSYNKLESLDEPFRDYLDRIATLPSHQTCNRSDLIKVVLMGNPIRCTCDNRPFLRWLSVSPVHIWFYETDECNLMDGRRLQLKNRDVIPEFLYYLDAQCVPYVWIGVSLGIFVLSISFCLVVYRFRWRLRHLYYSKRRRYQHKGYDRLFERDAFISYAKSEAGFVKNKLVPNLEEGHGLHVWVADRDAVAGASIAENLTHAIYSSKKSVLLLSRRYLTESWCNYEMNMARIESVESQRKLMVIVLYDDMSAKEMPLDYLRLLRSVQLIEYPHHPQDLDTFWTTLVEAIRRT